MFHPSTNVPRGTFYGASVEHYTGQAWNILLKIVMSIAVIQSVVAIFQFILQYSIGLFWLKESLISPEILGVAKVIIGGEKFIRSYGLFPHPNILGGFFLFSIIITILYQRMFHPRSKEIVPSQYRCSTWNILRGTRGTISCYGAGVEHFTGQAWNNSIILIQILALLLTFSKSAIAGLFLGLAYLYYKNVPRGTFLLRIGKYLKKIILIASITVLLLLLTKFDSRTFLFRSLDERGLYLKCSTWNISDNPIMGVGAGQFVLNMQNYCGQVLEFWQFQPVHNVFLLIWSELGLVGLLLFIYFLYKILWSKIVPRGTISIGAYFKAIFVGFLFIMLFDHYLWDIQQGQIMLWIVLGLIVATDNTIDK